MKLKDLYLIFLKQKYKKIKIYLRKGVKFEKCIFEGCGKVGNNSNVKSSFIGYGTYIGKECDLSFSKIGRFCSIGNNVKVIAGDHPIYDYVSTHPIFYTDMLKKEGLYLKGYKDRNTSKNLNENINGGGYTIEIGSDVWIGTNVSILGGVKIGNGAVIGTGAVVVKNVEPYSVVVGVPAKKIKERFTKEEISYLEKLKWWNKDKEWLEKNVLLFSNIKLFVEELKEKK